MNGALDELKFYYCTLQFNISMFLSQDTNDVFLLIFFASKETGTDSASR